MKLTFHGATYEVGRSCVELESDRRRILFDAGIKLGEETEYPSKINRLSKIDAVFLSHAHLDHSGALPYLNHNKLNCPIYTTEETKLMTKILLHDSFHIETLSHLPPYLKENVFDAVNLISSRERNRVYELNEINFKLFDAGHIAGASSVLVDVDNKSILYSGDINTSETKIATRENVNVKNPDALILESTYGDRQHPPRKQVEDEFVSAVKETLQKGGSVLIPAFAIGRAQEIMMILDKRIDVPVYLDGMAKEISNIFVQKQCCHNFEDFRNALRRTKQVRGWGDRRDLVKEQAVFISTAGMMDGGPVLDYLKFMSHDPKNSIFLVGYQAEGTNGRMLLEKGAVFIDGMRTKVKANYKQFDFSAHADLNGLKEFANRINPKKIILNHGDPAAVDNLAKELRSAGFEVYTPKLNSVINI
jgi:putative mRNA 3-end processing factor